MKMTKRLFLVLLALIVTMGCCACGDKKVGKKSGGSGDGSEDDITAAAENPERKYDGKENPYKDLDLGGETLSLGSFWDVEPDEEGSTTANTLIWQRVKYLENKYNCKIEWVQYDGGQFDAKMRATVAAGKPFVDVATVYTSSVPSYAISGYLQNLADLKCFDIKNKKWNFGVLDGGNINGRYYSFSKDCYVPRSIIAFNKTMFEKNGWENPYELYNSGKWTWEKFIEVAQKATDKAAGIYGFGGLSILPVGDSFGSTFVQFDKTGKPIFTGDSEESRLSLELQNNLKTKYDFSWTPETDTWSSYILALKEGKVAMAATQVYMIRENILDMEDDYGIVGVPKGSNAKGTYSSTAGDVPVNVFLANNPKAQEKAYILDLLFEPYEGYDRILATQEFETYCRDDESVQILLDLEENYLKFSKSIWFATASGLYGQATASVTSSQATFGEAMSKYKGQIQAALDEVYASWNKK